MSDNYNENDNKKTRGMILDIIVSVLAILILAGCGFFWKDKYDLPATILAAAIVLCGGVFLVIQHRKSRAAE